MADHVRKQIRIAALTALTGLTTTGANAFASRLDPLPDANLPALLVDTLDEEIRNATLGGSNRLLDRTLTLTVKACVKATSGYQNTVDQIAKEVETALGNNNTLGALCKYITPTRQSTELTGEGDKPVAVYTMTFDVYYITALNAPDVSF